MFIYWGSVGGKLYFCLSFNVFISPLLLKEIFTGAIRAYNYKLAILVWVGVCVQMHTVLCLAHLIHYSTIFQVQLSESIEKSRNRVPINNLKKIFMFLLLLRSSLFNFFDLLMCLDVGVIYLCNETTVFNSVSVFWSLSEINNSHKNICACFCQSHM